MTLDVLSKNEEPFFNDLCKTLIDKNLHFNPHFDTSEVVFFAHPEILRDVNMEAVPSNYVFIVSETLSQNHLLVLPATKIDIDKHIALFGGWVTRGARK